MKTIQSQENMSKDTRALLTLNFALSNYMMQVEARLLPKEYQPDNVEDLLGMLVLDVNENTEDYGFKNFKSYVFNYRPEIIPTILHKAGFQGHEKPTLHKLNTLLGAMDYLAFLSEMDKNMCQEMQKQGIIFEDLD